MTALTGVVALLSAAVCARGALRRRRMRAELAALARRRGMNYHPADELGVAKKVTGLAWAERGYDRAVSDIVSGAGPAGSIYCFRYRYEQGFGAERRTVGLTVGVLQLDGGPIVRMGEIAGSDLSGRGVDLECRDGLISLRLPDGSSAQYDLLLDALARLTSSRSSANRSGAVAVSV